MLRRLSALLVVLYGAMPASVVVDRMAVIVGKHVIKSSDIERELRVTDFINGERLDLGVDARKKSAERLIDQSIIRDEMVKGAYAGVGEADVAAMRKSLVQGRFGGSSARFQAELARYGLTEELLRVQLEWQLDVLKFIDQRFRPGVLVTDEEVRSYYEQHRTELERQYPQAKTYEALEPKIRTSLEGERLNQNFEQWLAAARKRNRIEYRQGAFQ